MKSYQIADIEQLTGIKAHTIRIWEKRYKLIEPDRSPTNIRKYDDKQVKKLLNIRSLLGNGYKISKIAALSDKQINEKIISLQQIGSDNYICETFINDLIFAMLSFDEVAFEKIYSAAVTRLGLFQAFIQVFYPLLRKIGMLWVVDQATPVQEHFASSIMRRKIMAATDGLPLNKKKGKTFILFLPPDEYHEIALLFANYIIKANGGETIYLGQNVPLKNLNEVIKIIEPDYLLTFFNSSQTLNEIQELVSSIQSTKLLMGGNFEIIAKIKKHKNLIFLKEPSDLKNYLI